MQHSLIYYNDDVFMGSHRVPRHTWSMDHVGMLALGARVVQHAFLSRWLICGLAWVAPGWQNTPKIDSHPGLGRLGIVDGGGQLDRTPSHIPVVTSKGKWMMSDSDSAVARGTKEGPSVVFCW